MSEILFRAQKESDDEWVYGNLILDKYSSEFGIIESNYCGDEILRDIIIPVKKETICQLVKKNKDGINIFTKDVVEIPYQTMQGSTRKCLLDWNDHCSTFLLFEEHGMTHTLYDECLIIGNIIDNPSLFIFEK